MASPAPQRFGAPETYTPKHLAERAINSKAALEGERKQVTVLFADLNGSMELLAGRDGDVVVRSIGSDLRMDYTAVGETTHLAARMEQMAAPGSILLGPQTVRLTADGVTLGRVGALPVKELSEPIEVQELLGAAPLQSRLHQAAACGFVSFVGREHEVAQLEGAVTRARRGQGQVIATLGEAGVGKSRLYWEFTGPRSLPACAFLRDAQSPTAK